MTQLVIEGVALPEAPGDKYKCYPKQLGAQKEMISGRMVTEIRGIVQVVEWSYDCLPQDTYAALLAALRSGTSVSVAYLPDDGSAMISSDFVVTSWPTPSFAFSKKGEACWHNVSFALREVKPHA